MAAAGDVAVCGQGVAMPAGVPPGMIAFVVVLFVVLTWALIRDED